MNSTRQQMNERFLSMNTSNIIDIADAPASAKPDSAVYSVRRMLKNALLIAVRDSVNNGLQIHANDFIGISQGAVKVVDGTKVDCLMDLIASIDDIDDRCILTVFYGLDVTSDERDEVKNRVAEAYPLMDFIEVDGEQTIYPFIIAVA